MTLSVAIMAHRKREHWVPELQEQLGPCEVVWDRHNDRHETGLRSLQAYDPRATHHLIVQDDALPCRDFRYAAEKVLRLTGEHPVAFYMGSVGPSAATLRAMSTTLTPRFIAGAGPHWGVAVAVPTEHIPDLTAWYEEQNIPNYDRRIARWYGKENIDCFYTAPSLVEHRHEDNPSLVRGRNDGRKAAWFIGDKSAAGLVWDTDAWTVPPKAPVVAFRGPSGRIVKMRQSSVRFARYRDHPMWEEV